MEARIINRVRGLASGRLSARYRRLRFADDVALRIAELDEERARVRYDDEDDDRWYREYDPRAAHLDALLAELRARIRAAAPFNPLKVASTERLELVSRAEPERGNASVEQRLVEHYDRLGTHSLDAWLVEDDLARLEAIADERLGGWLDPLVGLALFRPFWIRPLASWRAPEGKPRARVVASLVEHLLVEFTAPRWLCNAWLVEPGTNALRGMTWLIALGQGGSLRRLIELAALRWPDEWRPLPSKWIAMLARVPDTLSLTRGSMFAEILRLGGAALELRWLERAGFVLDPSAGGVEAAELEFWRSTVGWLVRHRNQLDDDASAMILAWARHMQTERERRGACFDWSGRTIASVRREADAYRQSLVAPWGRRLSWREHGWDWQGRFGEQDWTIRELRTSDALRAESLAMSHCVRLYDLACWRGHTAIFSVMQGERRCVTVEISVATRGVVQAKRACNQTPSAIEAAVIEHWRTTIVAGLT